SAVVIGAGFAGFGVVAGESSGTAPRGPGCDGLGRSLPESALRGNRGEKPPGPPDPSGESGCATVPFQPTQSVPTLTDVPGRPATLLCKSLFIFQSSVEIGPACRTGLELFIPRASLNPKQMLCGPKV
ncbi:MAG TPA: hypothetical protein VM260_06800, partial [Pirellula sp.]|nr:hypothetical protein [Pirellula sp.]